MGLDKKFQSILWEYYISRLNLDDDIVVQRVLGLADKDVSDYWIEKLGKEKAKELFQKNIEYLDKKSANYWSIYFDVENNLNNTKTMYEKLNKPVFTRNFE